MLDERVFFQVSSLLLIKDEDMHLLIHLLCIVDPGVLRDLQAHRSLDDNRGLAAQGA